MVRFAVTLWRRRARVSEGFEEFVVLGDLDILFEYFHVFEMDVGGTHPVGLVEYVESMLLEGVKFKHIAVALNIHDVRQLKRFMEKQLGRKFRVHDCLPLPELCDKVEELLPIHEQGVQWGTRQVRAALRSHGLRIPHRHVDHALEIISPFHRARRRQERRLIRAQYNVTKPMALWHMDSYDKISMFGIRVHAAIDGASHFIVYAKAASNKRAPTIFSAYMEAFRKYGAPLRIRSDYAAEHNLVAEHIRMERQNIQNSFLTGSSVHNQRIEHWWRHLWERCIFFFKNSFLAMQRSGRLNIDDPLQRECFVFVFLPEVQAAVSEYVDVWNLHLVRRINENGRYSESHVPQRYFREFERRHQWLDHLVEDPHELLADDDIGTQDPGPVGNEDWRDDVVEHPDFPEAPARLPQILENLRAEAYTTWLQSYEIEPNAVDRFVFHYNLSRYCYEALAHQVYFNVLDIVEDSELSELALEALVQLQER